MPEKVSRRFFLKVGGLAGAAALALQPELSAWGIDAIKNRYLKNPGALV